MLPSPPSSCSLHSLHFTSRLHSGCTLLALCLRRQLHDVWHDGIEGYRGISRDIEGSGRARTHTGRGTGGAAPAAPAAPVPFTVLRSIPICFAKPRTCTERSAETNFRRKMLIKSEHQTSIGTSDIRQMIWFSSFVPNHAESPSWLSWLTWLF